MDKELELRVDRALFNDHLNRIPRTIGGMLCAAGIMTVCAYGSITHLVLACWLGPLVANAAWRFALYKRLVGKLLNREELARARTVCAIQQLIAGSAWGFGAVLIIPTADLVTSTMMVMVIGGIMGSTAVSVGPIRLLSSLYLLPIALGSALSFFQLSEDALIPSVLLLTLYIVFIARSVADNARAQTAAEIHQLKNEASLETVKLLLCDFESHSADWLWEVDADLRIQSPSDRFTEMMAANDHSGTDPINFLELFVDDGDRETLRLALAMGTPFRDHDVTIRRKDERKSIWRLSGKPNSVGGFRGVARDVTEEALADRQVNYLVSHDSMTGLGNRFAFCKLLEEQIAANRRGAILLLDLDRFKQVNDTLGHPAGDAVLCEVARRIREVLRESDYAARLGGDEFAILLDKSASAEATRIAGRIVERVRPPVLISGVPVSIGVSIGVATLHDEPNAQEAMKRADLALYEAKESGRGTWCAFDNAMRARAHSRTLLEARIIGAIERSEFELHYQPLVDIRTGDLKGFEGLLRWNDQDEGMIMPDRFIPVAEESGSILRLGEIALERGFAALAAWPETIGLSLNLSAIQLRQDGLVAAIVRTAKACQIDLRRLELEITESAMIMNDELHNRRLRQLKDLGIKLAIDDYGSGHSSVAYLRDFPFDRIKIDRNFVQNIDRTERDLAIVKSVCEVARALEMQVTVEGIESQAQFATLQTVGCDTGQGFLFSQAVNRRAADAMVNKKMSWRALVERPQAA